MGIDKSKGFLDGIAKTVGSSKLRNLVSAQALAVLLATSGAANATNQDQNTRKASSSGDSSLVVKQQIPDNILFEANDMLASKNEFLSSSLNYKTQSYSLRKVGADKVQVFIGEQKAFEVTKKGVESFDIKPENEQKGFTPKLAGEFLGNKAEGKILPGSAGINGVFNYGNENFSVDLALEQILKDQIDTRFKATFSILYASKKMGTSVHIEKSSKLGQYLLTQGINLNGHSIKLTAGVLEKIMDFSFAMEGNKGNKEFNNVTLRQQVIAGEYKYKFSNDYVKEISSSIIIFDVDGKKLGKVDDIIKDTPEIFEWHEKNAFYQGGSKIIYQAGLVLRANDNLKFEPTIGLEKVKYNPIGEIEGSSNETKFAYGIKATYQPTHKDLIEGNFRTTNNYNEYGVTYSHKFDNGIEGYVKGTHTDYDIGNDNSEIGVGIKYTFGGSSKSYQPLFNDQIQSRKELSLGDLKPISRAASQNIEAGKQTTHNTRIAYIDKTKLNAGDTIVNSESGAQLLLDNNGFNVTSIREVSDSNYSKYFGVVDGKLSLVDMKGVIAQMEKDGIKKGEVKNLRISVNDTSGISVYEINIESGSVIINSSILRINEVPENLVNQFLDNDNLSFEELEQLVEEAKDKIAPVVVGETFTVEFGQSLTGINVLANDSDNSGVISLGTLSNQVGGTFTINNGKIDFVPNPGFSGNASVDYIVVDPNGNSSVGKLTIVVKANQAPTSTVISPVQQNEGSAFSLNVSSHFNDVNEDVLTYSSTGLPSGLNINTSTGVISGTLPNVTTDTPYSVTVTASDGSLTTSQTFTLTVLNVDTQAPVVNNVSVNALFGESKTGIDVLASASDDSGNVSLKNGGLSNQVGGTFSINNGRIDFVPNSGFSGNASVNYIVVDPSGNESVGTLTVNVAANQTPTITSISDFDLLPGQSVTKSFTVNNPEGTPVEVKFFSYDVKVSGINIAGGTIQDDSHPLAGSDITITGVPSGTTVTFTVTRTIYDNGGDNGDDLFFAVQDQEGLNDYRQSRITYTTPNTAPTITPTSDFSITEFESVNKTFTVNDSQGGSLDLNIETEDVKITITNAGGGNVSYIKDGNAGNGSSVSITGVPAGTTIEYTVTDMSVDNGVPFGDQIKFTATDNGGLTDTATTNITFN